MLLHELQLSHIALFIMARYRRRSSARSKSPIHLVFAVIVGSAFAFLYLKLTFGTFFSILIIAGIALIILALFWFFIRKFISPSLDLNSPQVTNAPVDTLNRNEAQWVPVHQASPSAFEQSNIAVCTTLNLELLHQLEWKRFEDFVAAYVREMNLVARTTRIGADGGIDVEVLEPGSDKVILIIQCKAWSSYKVGIKAVRELFGVMAASKVVEGAFFTTSVFTEEALEFGRTNHIDLVDGSELIARIEQLSDTSQARLYEIATEGDFSTPTCPQCGIKMVRRTAKQGQNAGSEFWGCRNYPRCKRTF